MQTDSCAKEVNLSRAEFGKGQFEMNIDTEYAKWKGLQESVRTNRVADWLRAGEDPNHKFKDRKITPLHLAVRWHKMKAVRTLLAAGADPSPAANFGINLLHTALGELRDEFLNHKTWARCRRADAPAALIAELVEAGVPTDSPDANWRTPLHRAITRATCAWATTEAAFDSAHILLAKGAPVNRPDIKGVRPLHLAVGNTMNIKEDRGERHSRLVQSLLAAGAKVDVIDDAGNTPLLNAIRAMNPDSLQLLLAAGAKTDAADKHGNSAFYWVWTHQPLRDWLKQDLQCLSVLLNSCAPIPPDFPTDFPIDRALVFLRDHRADNTPVPDDVMDSVEIILPHIQRSETWWSDFMSNSYADSFHQHLLQNSSFPERFKPHLHAASI